MTRPGLLVLGAMAVAGAAATGCVGPALPDPRLTADEYAAAVTRGDARALHGLLTEEARRAHGEDGTGRLLADQRAEMMRLAKAVRSPNGAVRAVAEVRYVDGERAELRLEKGRFRVSAAAGLPSGSRTPAGALAEFRSALARRSYAALIRVLSADTRTALERDARSLVDGLEHPEALDVKVRGETAEVVIPGGHKVLLKREAGVWRIHDFD